MARTGEPVVIDGKTIIPVAKVADGFGIVEVSEQETKFVPFGQTKRLAWAAANSSGLGLLVGLLLGRRARDRS